MRIAPSKRVEGEVSRPETSRSADEEIVSPMLGLLNNLEEEVILDHSYILPTSSNSHGQVGNHQKTSNPYGQAQYRPMTLSDYLLGKPPINFEPSELSKLQKDCYDLKDKFLTAQVKLFSMREQIKDKEKEKSSLQSKITQCDSEIATMKVKLANEEKNFNTFTHDNYNKLLEEIVEFKDVNRNQGVPKNIRDDLECICCFEIMGQGGAMIFQCAEGHLICKTCHQRLKQCPVCRKPYPNPGIRCRMAEKIANSN